MNPAIGLAVTIRVRMGARDAYQPTGVVDGARILALFTDVASELMIRLDGDEGVLRGYQQVEMLAPVFVGDYIEATGVVTKISGATRQIAFEARKVITYVRSANLAVSAADALSVPTVVCRALGSSVVPRNQQRRPKLVVPALPAVAMVEGRLPEGHVVVTPPPHVVVTPPRETPPEVLLAASIVGAGVSRDHTPHIPVTAEEVAQEAKRCRDAGACMVHLGVDGSDAEPDAMLNQVRERIDAIRAATDVLIAVSAVTAPLSLQARQALVGCGADLVSLPGGSFNFGDAVVPASRADVRQLARTIGESSSAALVECFELGHVDEALLMMRDKLLASPLRCQLVFGVPGAMGAYDEHVRLVASRMPKGAQWFAAGVGRHQRRVTELALRLGGNVRVGLADNIFARRGVLAESSAEFVDRAATFARGIGRQPVEPSRAKQRLALVASSEAEPSTEPSPEPEIESGNPEQGSSAESEQPQS